MCFGGLWLVGVPTSDGGPGTVKLFSGCAGWRGRLLVPSSAARWPAAAAAAAAAAACCDGEAATASYDTTGVGCDGGDGPSGDCGPETGVFNAADTRAPTEVTEGSPAP